MSSNLRNNYPLEFKISAVKLSEDSDQSYAQIARDLGVNVNTLYHWIAKYSDSNKSNQNNMNVNNKASCFEENKRLKKELGLVKQERDLLKKAAAYFAKTSQ
jgi:transposase